MTYEIQTQSHEAPSVRRWQDGYEIPVNITHNPATSDRSECWDYARVIVPALTAIDVTSAVDRDFDSDAGVLAEALGWLTT
jgi:hypothetical protein